MSFIGEVDLKNYFDPPFFILFLRLIKQHTNIAIRITNKMAAPAAISGKWSSMMEDVCSSSSVVTCFVKSGSKDQEQ